MDIASEGFWVTVTVFSTSPDRILKEAVRSSGELLPDAVTLIEFDPAGPSAGLMEHHPPAGSLAKEVLPDAVTLIEFDPAGPSAGLMEHHPPAGSLAKEADQT